MKNFENLRNCTNLEDLKKEYKKLVMMYHPDICTLPNATELMQQLNNEYDLLFSKLKNTHLNSNGEEYTTTTENEEMPEEFRNIINQLIKLIDVKIEVIGSFIWLSGNTIAYKDIIKSLGFRWSKNKVMWYKSPKDYKKISKKNYNIDDIRNMFGSSTIQNKPSAQLN